MTPTIETYVRSRNFLRRGLVGVALGGLWLSAAAQNVTYSTSAFANPRWDLPGSSALSTPTGASTLPSRAPSVPGGVIAGNTMIFESGSQPKASWTSDVPVTGSNGRTVSATATTVIPKTSAGAAMAKFAKRGLPIVSTGFAIHDLLTELGFFAREDGWKVKYPPAEKEGAIWYQYIGCTPSEASAPCTAADNGPYPPGYYSTRQAAFDEMRTQYNSVNDVCPASPGTYTTRQKMGPASAFTLSGGTMYWYAPVERFYCISATGSLAPITGSGRFLRRAISETEVNNSPETIATESEIADKIAAQSGWPSRSTQALAEAMKHPGMTLQAPLPTLTGPASTTGTTTTTNKADGTKVVASTVHNHTYNNNTINTTTVTTTTTYNASNQPISTETSTSEAIKPDKPPEEEKTDECEANPERIGCAELDTPEGEIPKADKALTYVAEALGFGGGSCPAPIVRSIRGQAVTVFSYAQGCALLATYVRPMVLALSAWIAFMILIPGGRPE